MLGGPVDSIEQIRGIGRNSGVYRVTQGSGQFALKRYPPRQEGERDRAGIEFAALRFMAAHGIAAVPRALAVDPGAGYALLEWIDGESVADPDERDIDDAVAFLAAIHAFRGAADARALPPAQEACLSAAEIARQIDMRLARLDRLADDEPALAALLAAEYRPLLAAITARAETGYATRGLAFATPIDPAARTLCPADFGFHNALRTTARGLVFLDFDYFGWDDPAKLVADFLLHPGMRLPEPLKRRFAAAAEAIYGADPDYPTRLALLRPLFALRWCLILLNEFLPERWTYRVNAGTDSDWAASKQRQLDRTREWVQSLATNFR